MYGVSEPGMVEYTYDVYVLHQSMAHAVTAVPAACDARKQQQRLALPSRRVASRRVALRYSPAAI